MHSKTVLVTGADGQLGRALRRASEGSAAEYIFTDLAELDITDREAVLAFVARQRIDTIVNCAAYTDVERAEQEEAAAERINAEAVRYLAQAALAANGTLFHISTDYVFGTEGNLPRREEMPVDPLGAYGRTKLRGEQAIAQVGCRAIVFRTGWLYSEFGNNFLKTILRLTAEKESLKVVFDQVGTPTCAADLAQAICTIIGHDLHTGREGLYHYANEGVCSWYDFAQEIAAAAGRAHCRIHPCRSEEFPSKVRRPAYSVLDKTKFKESFGLDIPHWRESMIRCIERLQQQ